ncbi:hypothetical protein M422DRAFT_276171 [Sphaerobolus stellatus SS14]|uniref:Unplaced genomic scaffold SPHSTscaffold_657, whole genome shotgun sequence n=1 Tax=Sphaerobolus stellatus (strain SS14) TaxID=990650 RepID=A0A0C9UDR9_SPHS4|nr:hypothetical protein M422DRAFT_276171 [Sphaerobolus stellatus SS14]
MSSSNSSAGASKLKTPRLIRYPNLYEPPTLSERLAAIPDQPTNLKPHSPRPRREIKGFDMNVVGMPSKALQEWKENKLEQQKARDRARTLRRKGNSRAHKEREAQKSTAKNGEEKVEKVAKAEDGIAS